jgi:hypothetical protein
LGNAGIIEDRKKVRNEIEMGGKEGINGKSETVR